MSTLRPVRIATIAALGALMALSAQAQTTTITASGKAHCETARADLQANLDQLRDVQTNLTRLKGIIRGYQEQRATASPENAGLFMLDTVYDKAAAHEARIEELTRKAGINRAQIKQCDGAVAS